MNSNDQDLADKNEHLIRLFHQAGKFLHRAHHMQGHPRHAQRRILAILMERESINQKVLLEILDIRSSSLSEILAKMEGRGFISRERDEEDRRNYVIHITEKGRDFMANHGAEQHEKKNNLFAALSKEDHEQLEGLMQKLVQSWEETFSGDGCGKHEGRGCCGRHGHRHASEMRHGFEDQGGHSHCGHGHQTGGEGGGQCHGHGKGLRGGGRRGREDA